MPARGLMCAVGVCNNYYYKTKNLLHEGHPITYHYFPKNIDLCNRWVEACNRDEKFMTEVCFVCSVHFRPEDFTKQSTYSSSLQPKRRLKHNVVPTRNLTLDDIRSFTSRNHWKKTDRVLGLQDDPQVINDSSEAKDDTLMGNSGDDEMTSMENKLEKLKKEFEDYKNNSKIEIEKLRSIVKEKDEVFTSKLKKILSQYLSETEIDLVLFLRKQKKQLADS